MDHNKQQRRRAPAGVDNRQIAMRLLPDELRLFDEVAAEFGMTRGALAREVCMKNIRQWRESQAAA